MPTTPCDIWFAVNGFVQYDSSLPPERRMITRDEARLLFVRCLATAANEAFRKNEQLWSRALSIANSCLYYMDDERESLEQALLKAAVEGAGNSAENELHAMEALRYLDHRVWLGETKAGEVVVHWFRECLEDEALLSALEVICCFDPVIAVPLIRHILEQDGKLNDAEMAREFCGRAGAVLAVWALWQCDESARNAFDEWRAEGPRIGVFIRSECWRVFLERFAWTLQDQVRQALQCPARSSAEDPSIAKGLARFVSLLASAWDAWTRVGDSPSFGLASAITAPIVEGFPRASMPECPVWSVALRELLIQVLAKGSWVDLYAFVQMDNELVDVETAERCIDAAVLRADRELADDHIENMCVEPLALALETLGKHLLVSRRRGFSALACLQRLGWQFPRATTIAFNLEKELRARDHRE